MWAEEEHRMKAESVGKRESVTVQKYVCVNLRKVSEVLGGRKCVNGSMTELRGLNHHLRGTINYINEREYQFVGKVSGSCERWFSGGRVYQQTAKCEMRRKCGLVEGKM